MSHVRETVRNTSIFSLFTIFSRFLGFFRDMLKAYAFGTGILSVAFDIAFRIPNMLRNLVAEGALSQAFIPLYEKHRHISEEEGRKAAGSIIIFTGITLAIISVIAWIVIPYVMPALVNDAQKILPQTQLIISLTQILFPYIFLMSVSSVYMGIQYSHRIYWAASFGPALLNIVIILGFGFYLLTLSERSLMNTEFSVYVFSAVTLLAAAVQLGFQIFTVHRKKLAPAYSLNFRNPALKGLWFMMLPAVFGASLQELGQLLDIYLANLLRNQVPEAVSALTYAHRLLHLPIGIFGVAVATASLPQLSKLYLEGKTSEYQTALTGAFRLNLFMLLPAISGLFIFAKIIVAISFQRGEFTEKSTEVTAFALMCYSPGILGYSLQKLFFSASYARQNTKIPAFITAAVLVINFSLSYILMKYLLHGGLALGSAIAAYAGALAYVVILMRRKLLKFSGEDKKEIIRILVLNISYAAILWGISYFTSGLPQGITLIIALGSVPVYFLMAKFLNITEYHLFNEILLKIRKRFGLA